MGGVGISMSPWRFFRYVISSVTLSPFLSIRIWFAIELLVGFIGTYLLSKEVGTGRYSGILAFSYVASPVTSGLFYSGALVAYFLYIVEPLFIFTMLRYIKSKSFRTRVYWLLLALFVFMISYYIDAQMIMWAGLILIVFLSFFILTSHQKFKQTASFIIELVIFLLISLLLSGSFISFIALISGNSVSAYSVADFGANSANQVLTTIVNNFRGYLRLYYAYMALICVSIFGFFYLKYHKHFDKIRAALFLALLTQDSIIVLCWFIFYFNVLPISSFLANHFPLVGAYEPLPGFSLIYSNLIMLVILSVSSKEEGRRKTPMKFVKFHHFRFKRITVVLVLFVVFLTFLPINYNNVDNPSIIDTFSKTSGYISTNEIPNGLFLISDWFYTHTNLDESYKIMTFPYSPSVAYSFQNSMPWTYVANISNQGEWTAKGAITTSNDSLLLSNLLASNGVKYLIVYKGNAIDAHYVSAYTGPIRFIGAGYHWQKSYWPAGSWQNWSRYLSSSNTYFKEVANLSIGEIFQNKLYKGVVSQLSLENQSNKDLNLTVTNSEARMLFKGVLLNTEHSLEINNYSNLKSSGFSDSISNLTSTVYSGVMNVSMRQLNSANLSNLSFNSYYKLSYYIKGLNMTSSFIFLNFYNQSGKLVYQFDSNWDGNVVWRGNSSFFVHSIAYFKTPVSFSHARLSIRVINNALNRTSYTYVSNITLTRMMDLVPQQIHYSFEKPYFVSGNITSNEPSIIVLSISFNPGWILSAGNRTYQPTPITTGQYRENAYLIPSYVRNFTITYAPQNAYSHTLKMTFALWITLMLFEVAIGVSILGVSKKRKPPIR